MIRGSYLVKGKEPCLLKTLKTSTPAPDPTQLSIQWFFSASFHEVKRPGSEADHSLPLCAKIHNEWNHNFTPPLPLYGVYTPSVKLWVVGCMRPAYRS